MMWQMPVAYSFPAASMNCSAMALRARSSTASPGTGAALRRVGGWRIYSGVIRVVPDQASLDELEPELREMVGEADVLVDYVGGRR